MEGGSGILVTMSSRIKDMRKLHDALVRMKTPGDWAHILEQTGMFWNTGLSREQVLELRTDYHVYMLDSGRASLCGLNDGNVEFLAEAIHSVLTKPNQ